MNNTTYRKRRKQTGIRETMLLLLAVAAVIAALAWKAPAATLPERNGAMRPIENTRAPSATEIRPTKDPAVTPNETLAQVTEPEPTEPPEPKKTYLGEFTVTAYCSCEICCGEWANNRPNGIVYTASGAEAVEGVTVGADWSILPVGTHIEIEGLGERIVQDKPADWIIERYDGKIIDAYFANHQAALDYGKHTVAVWIIEEPEEGGSQE